MTYTFKDFAEGNIVAHVEMEKWGEFVKTCRAEGLNVVEADRTNASDAGGYVYYRARHLLGEHCRTDLPRVEFRDLLPALILNPELWSKFLGGKIGVRCDTREQYDCLMQECERAGLRWHSGVKATQQDNYESGRTYIKNCGGLMYCSNIECSHGGKISKYCRTSCVHRANIPFPSLFLDVWAEFIAGKCYLRVTKDEWPEFAKRCEAAGITLWNGGDPVSRDIRNRDTYPVSIGLLRANRLAYASCGGDGKMPTYDFSALSQPQPAPEPVKADPDHPNPRPKVGDRFRMMKDDLPFKKGEIVKFVEDDGSHWPYFQRESDGMHNVAYFRNMEPLPTDAPEPEKPAPYDGRGKHKVGDRFEVLDGMGFFNRGSVIELHQDDGSYCPWFRGIRGGESWCVAWCRLKPLSAPTPFPRIEITTDGRVTTATLYGGDKAVKTGKATCSPEDKFDFMEGAGLALYRLRYGQSATRIPRAKVSEWASRVEKISKEMFNALD